MFNTLVNFGKDKLSSGSVYPAATREAGGFWNLQASSLEGDKIDFIKYKGCVSIIINVASKWGKTSSSYNALNKLYSEHKDEGLRILAFPSMDFAAQEYKDPTKIRSFVDSLGVHFDMFGVSKVSEPDMSPIYEYLLKRTANHPLTWNFSTVFIVGRDGSARVRIDQPQTDDWALVKRELKTCLKEVSTKEMNNEKKDDSQVNIPE